VIRRMIWIVPALAAVFALALAVPLPRPVTAQTGAACLVGDWISGDLEGYVRSAIGSGTSSLRVNRVSGTFGFSFDGSGAAQQRVNNVSVDATGSSGLDLNMVMTMNGTLNFLYSEAGPGVLTFSNASNPDLQIVARVNGIEFPLPFDANDLALWPSSGANADYTCSGNRLTLGFQIPDRVIEPVVFTRQ
jgi:hypothetical protein